MFSFRRQSPVALAFAFLYLAAGAVPGASASPYNNLLSRQRTEPAVAIDPRRPSTIVVGANTDYDAPVHGTYPVGVYVSHDAGGSFQAGTMPLPWPYQTAADPSLVIGRSGTIFYSYLGETRSYCSGGHSAILLSRSEDGGRSFQTPGIADTNAADDKPLLAVRDRPGKPAHVFLTWTRWHQQWSDVWYARSVDGGRTFSRAAMLFSSRDDNFGSTPVLGPHGRVYAFWSSFPDKPLTSTSPSRILMRVSSDEGRHFGPVRSIAGTFWTIPQMMEPGSLRSLTAPSVAAGRHGALYMAWAAASRDRGHGVVDVDILLSRSRDGGLHWTPGTRVNDTPRGDRFMPAISVFHDDSVGIVFYDRRLSPWTLDVYGVRASYAGGFHRSSNVRVNRGQSRVSDIYYIKPGSTCFASGRFFGDYLGAAAAPDNSLSVVWADTQLHVQGETDVWFARLGGRTLGMSVRRKDR